MARKKRTVSSRYSRDVVREAQVRSVGSRCSQCGITYYSHVENDPVQTARLPSVGCLSPLATSRFVKPTPPWDEITPASRVNETTTCGQTGFCYECGHFSVHDVAAGKYLGMVAYEKVRAAWLRCCTSHSVAASDDGEGISCGSFSWDSVTLLKNALLLESDDDDDGEAVLGHANNGDREGQLDGARCNGIPLPPLHFSDATLPLSGDETQVLRTPPLRVVCQLLQEIWDEEE